MKPVARALHRNPDAALRRLFQGLPKADTAALNEPGVKQDFVDTLREAFRSGNCRGGAGLRLGYEAVGVRDRRHLSSVHLWHGEDDTVVPVSMGRRLAHAIPECTATFLPGEGHFFLLPNHATEILQAAALDGTS